MNFDQINTGRPKINRWIEDDLLFNPPTGKKINRKVKLSMIERDIVSHLMDLILIPIRLFCLRLGERVLFEWIQSACRLFILISDGFVLCQMSCVTSFLCFEANAPRDEQKRKTKSEYLMRRQSYLDFPQRQRYSSAIEDHQTDAHTHSTHQKK